MYSRTMIERRRRGCFPDMTLSPYQSQPHVDRSVGHGTAVVSIGPTQAIRWHRTGAVITGLAPTRLPKRSMTPRRLAGAFTCRPCE